MTSKSRTHPTPPTSTTHRHHRPQRRVATIGTDGKVCYANGRPQLGSPRRRPPRHHQGHRLHPRHHQRQPTTHSRHPHHRRTDPTVGTSLFHRDRRTRRRRDRQPDTRPRPGPRLRNPPQLQHRHTPRRLQRQLHTPTAPTPTSPIATIGTDGQVCYANADLNWVHLVADHLGTIKASAYTPATTNGSPDASSTPAPPAESIPPSGRICVSP